MAVKTERESNMMRWRFIRVPRLYEDLRGPRMGHGSGNSGQYPFINGNSAKFLSS